MKKILLLQENSPAGDERKARLHAAGFDVVAADAQDLFWPKFVESGTWHAIVFDQSSFFMIYVEMASELANSPAARGVPLVLVTPETIPPEKLPSSFRAASQSNDQDLIDTLEGLNS